jgi:DNA end-binding protein Ku
VNLPDKESGSVRTMHAVEIFAFVEACEFPFSCFDTPYYLAPAPGGEKNYALLRETLDRTRKIGIAQVVIQARPLLAALVPCGSVLMLNTLRLDGAHATKRQLQAAPMQLSESELAMAAQMVESMTRKWDVVPGAQAVKEQAASAPGALIQKRDARTGLPDELHDEGDDAGTLAELLRPGIRVPEENRAADTGYQAQRNSRPRGRWRGTLH